MVIYRFLDEVKTNWIDDVQALMKTLTGREIVLSHDDFLRVAGKNRWLAALEEDDERIVGIGTLVPIYIPTGRCGRIEDVVVLDSPSYRGKGIGRELMTLLISEARRLGLGWITLTSKPKRITANGLYQVLGFVQYETNNYRLSLL